MSWFNSFLVLCSVSVALPPFSLVQLNAFLEEGPFFFSVYPLLFHPHSKALGQATCTAKLTSHFINQAVSGEGAGRDLVLRSGSPEKGFALKKMDKNDKLLSIKAKAKLTRVTGAGIEIYSRRFIATNTANRRGSTFASHFFFSMSKFSSNRKSTAMNTFVSKKVFLL